MIGPMIGPTIDRSALGKPPRLLHNRQQSTARGTPDSSAAARPDDLGVTPWYLDELGIGESSSSSGICERGGPYTGSSGLRAYPRHSERSLPIVGRYELYSNRDRESSVESTDFSRGGSTAPRKAYMDLTDAIALLDETCPNQEYSASPSLTPRTPRTPLTPFPRGRRARSKSSDNSSNYSNEVTCDRSSLETSKSQDKHDRIIKHRRPFLRKIGISMTEDRPFLAKIIAPKIIGKPYLEKIGPSRAVEKPFLEKIGSSKTLDRFTFDTLRELPRVMVRRRQPAEPSPLTIERNRTEENDDDDDDDDLVEDIIVVVKDIEGDPEEDEEAAEEEDENGEVERTIEGTNSLSRIESRRTNGKGYLLKMYSFETEDLNDSSNAANKSRRDPLRGASLDDVLDSGPSSFPPSEDSHEHASSRSDERSFSGAELVKCRVTTSEEIFSTTIEGTSSSPRETTSWRNSPRWPKRRSRRVASAPRSRAVEREDNTRRVFPSDESTPNSPTKRRISPERTDDSNDRLVVSRTKNSSLPRYPGGSPSKARRQAASEEPSDMEERRSRRASEEIFQKDESRDRDGEKTEAFARCKSRRQTFKEAVEKFGGSETKTRRQVSEEMLDKNRKIDDSERFDDPYNRFRERRGISSDNLKLSRETVVASVPSTSSLGYQSGDSSLVSQRSSHHSQDFVRGTLKILHDKFELQEVPSESYAAFKRRTRANHNRLHDRTAERDYSRNEETPSIVSTMRNRNNKNNSSGTTAPVGTYYNNNNNNHNNNNTPGSASVARDSKEVSTRSTSEDTTTSSKSSITTKSVLRKQDGVDHQSDQEMETSVTTLRCPKRRIIHEPSQETMDLLTELRRVKSLLKRTPSIEVDEIGQDFGKPLSRFPKKILLTDKEFCLSVERENSVRRRPSALPEPNSSETEKREESLVVTKENEAEGRVTTGRDESSGPALFEKRCLSLDYADEEKPPKPDVRAISLASARLPACSGTEETIDSSDLAGLAYDARSYCSDVFTATPSDETDETRNRIETRSSEESPEIPIIDDHCVDLDIAIPVDHVGSIGPKRRIHIQGRTSDLYEIISPRSTPFRVKRRLGRISVEETVKQESFTLSKLDCRTLATQKKTKCFPL